MDINKFLIKLINIKSISENEKEICDYIYEFLRQKELNPIKDSVDENGYNIIVKKGKPKIYLQAHCDTVIPFIKAREDEDKIYGRGSCDTKASIVSMIFATLKAKEKNLDNFGLIITVGEETSFRGIYSLVKNNDFGNSFFVCGEPTSLKLVNELFGMLVVRIDVKGKSAHTSNPQLGENAIDSLNLFVNKFRKKVDLGETNCSLTRIGGGESDNIVPDKAWGILSFRLSPNDKNDYLKILNELKTMNIKIKKISYINPVKTKLSKKLEFLGKGQAKKYCAELNVIGNGIVLGPGDIKYAHSEVEFVLKKELKKASEIYFKIIKEYQK